MTVAFVCAWANDDRDAARTVAIHVARPSSTANTTTIASSNRRMREFTTRAIGLLPREVEVARVRRRCRNETELARGRLDEACRRRARHLRLKRLVLCAQLQLLLVE